MLLLLLLWLWLLLLLSLRTGGAIEKKGEKESGSFKDLFTSRPPDCIFILMLLPPSINLFRDDCIHELDLQRIRDFLYENTGNPSVTANPQESSGTSTTVLMDILRKDEGNEQELIPFSQDLLKPLQNLPPGKLPGVNFDASLVSLPTSIFSSSSLTGSPGNSPKRRKLDTAQQSSQHQNVTIQHF